MKSRKKSKAEKINPEEVAILKELEDVLTRLGIEFRYEKGFFKGGLCRIDNKQYFYLSKNVPFEQKLNVIVQQLKVMDLDDVYLKPKLRELLEESIEKI
ncbi:MAG: hypothetical protein Kow00108_26050 [Calditrichia bacterium]